MKGRKFAVPLALLLALLVFIPSASACWIDVKPGSWPNSINVCNNGVIPVAYACEDDLEAEDYKEDIKTIKVKIKIDGEEYSKQFKCGDVKLGIEDVTSRVSNSAGRGPDGCDDLTMKFRTQDLFEVLCPAKCQSEECPCETVYFYVYGYSDEECTHKLFSSDDIIRFVPANCKEVNNEKKPKK